MSGTTRTTVMTAILEKINAMTFSTQINGTLNWNLVSNRLRLWGDVPADQQPSAFLLTHKEMDEYRGLGLYRRRLELLVFCYCRTDSDPGGPMLDIMMESFEAAFNVPDDFGKNTNTLNGLVYWCRIEGRTFKDPGDIDKQAMLIVPIVVEMP